MKKALLLAAAMSFSSSVAFAGGPIVVIDEGEPVVVETKRSGSGMLLPVILGVAILAAVAGGSDGT